MYHDATLPWSDDQWTMIERLMQDTARKSRIAASFLPLEGPLPPGQEYVAAMEMESRAEGQQLYQQGGGAGLYGVQGRAELRLRIEESATVPLVTIASAVYLKVGQAQDPDLVAAKQMISRVADVLGRVEDEIIFNGLTREFVNGYRNRLEGGGNMTLLTRPPLYVVRGPSGAEYPGLLTVPPTPRQWRPPTRGTAANAAPLLLCPGTLVDVIVSAVQILESEGYSSPYACVLGTDAFRTAVSPNRNMIMPSERILPFLGGGPLLRSVALAPTQGIVTVIDASLVDLVIGSDLAVGFLALTQEPRYVLSVSESFRLRIKDLTSDGPSVVFTF